MQEAQMTAAQAAQTTQTTYQHYRNNHAECSVSIAGHYPVTVDSVPGVCSITRNVSLILVERQGLTNLHDIVGRVFLAIAQVSTDVLFISQSSAQGNFCFVVPRESACCALNAIQSELAPEMEH